MRGRVRITVAHHPQQLQLDAGQRVSPSKRTTSRVALRRSTGPFCPAGSAAPSSASIPICSTRHPTVMGAPSPSRHNGSLAALAPALTGVSLLTGASLAGARAVRHPERGDQLAG